VVNRGGKLPLPRARTGLGGAKHGTLALITESNNKTSAETSESAQEGSRRHNDDGSP
jgi:hypothetical protein